MNSKLYIGNLAPNVSESDLRALFLQAGAVTAVELVLDPTSGQSRGYGFVTMATPELAAAALENLHCYKLGERHITVTEARPPQEPKGLISEGFQFQSIGPFRAKAQQHKTRRQTKRPPRGRGRGR